jgi:aromatic ring hydroxylase
MLKTPERYLDEIRARDLRIFYRGERFANPVDHPVAAPAARCVAETYAAALEPDSGMAVESPLVGEPVNVSNLLWTRRDDLIARVRWERRFGRRTGRGALRSPGLDAINALAVVTHACDRARGTDYHRRLLAFVERIRRRRARGDADPAPPRDPARAVRGRGAVAHRRVDHAFIAIRYPSERERAPDRPCVRQQQ